VPELAGVRYPGSGPGPSPAAAAARDEPRLRSGGHRRRRRADGLRRWSISDDGPHLRYAAPAPTRTRAHRLLPAEPRPRGRAARVLDQGASPRQAGTSGGISSRTHAHDTQNLALSLKSLPLPSASWISRQYLVLFDVTCPLPLPPHTHLYRYSDTLYFSLPRTYTSY
jgi:hypothetical protein